MTYNQNTVTNQSENDECVNITLTSDETNIELSTSQDVDSQF